MSPLRLLLGQSLIYGFGQGVSRLINLFSLPILTHYLAPGAYGVISLLVVFGIALRVVFGIGSSGAAGIVYFRSDGRSHRRKTIWSLLGLTAVGGTLMLAFATFLGPAGGLVFGVAIENQQPLLCIYAMALAVQLLAEPLLLRLQFERYAARYAIVSATGAVAIAGWSVLLVAVFELGVLGWVIGQLVGALILLVVAGAAAGPGIGAPEPSRALMKSIFRAGVPLIPGGIAVLIMLSSAPFFVGTLLGLDQAGVYAVGYQIGLGMGLATMAVSAAWMPFFQSYVNRAEEASLIFPNLTTSYLAGFGIVTLLFFAMAPIIVDVFANERFYGAWKVVGMVALAQMLIGLWGMLLPGLYFALETGYVSVIQIISAVTTVAAHLVLIPLLGIVGGGMALVFGTSLLVLLQICFNNWRGYSVKVLEPNRFFVLLVLLLIMSATLWTICNSEISVPLAILASSAATLVFGGAAMLSTGALSYDRIAMIGKKRLSRV